MNRKAEIKQRLKTIATDMAANIENQERTDELETQYTALEQEAGKLEAELATIEASEQTEARRTRAESLATLATQATRVTTPNPTRISNPTPCVASDPRRGFRNIADFAAHVMDAGSTPRLDPMLMQIAAGTGMSQSVNVDGGVLVPPAFSKTVWDRVRMRSNSMLADCDVIPVDAGVESVTIPAIAESSRATGSRQGGIRGYWKSELGTLSSSQMKFREIKLTPQELYVFCYISDKLLRNAPGTASQMIETGAADEIAFMIGDSVFNGDGLGKPIGVIGHTATVSVSKETGQAAATIMYENLSKMWARCHPNWRAGAKWYINVDVETALRNMQFPVGTGGIPVYLPPGGASESPYATLFGRPVVPVEYCATVGTVGDIVLANFNAYASAVKGMTDTAWSMHLKFDYAQSAFRVIFEIDGQPWLNSAITPYKGSNTLSPIITLATRS